MRAVLIDPRSKRVVLIPSVEDVHRLALTRIGEESHWSICQDEGEGKPGLLLCSEENAPKKIEQKFFRLIRCATTFAGPCLFIGHLTGKTHDVPDWFWEEVSSKVIWLPTWVILLGWQEVRTPVTCQKTNKKTEEEVVVNRPVYGKEGGLGS